MGEWEEGGNQENGESNGILRIENDKDSKQWITFSSISDIQKQSRNWTLAGDAGLLEYLQCFSHQLISQTHEIEKHVDQLIHETKVTSSRVNNIINDFLMLSNTQFIENRVYDEDVQAETTVQLNKQEELKTKEQREAELIPQIQTALALGLEVIDKAFDRVEIQGDSDSEDEEGGTVHGESLLAPKDPYLHRPLPHVIGSESFYNDDTIGLFDLICNDIESESDRKEYDSGGESTDESFEEPVALGKENAPIQKKILQDGIPNFAESSDSESSDMFGDEAEYISGSADSGEFMKPEKPNNLDTSPVKEKPEPEEDESEDLFSDVFVSNKVDEKPSFLQSSPSKNSLFDDDDEDDNFEDTSPKTKERANTGQSTETITEAVTAPVKKVNDLKGKQVMIAKDLDALFQATDDDLFAPRKVLEKARTKERIDSVTTDVKPDRTKSINAEVKPARTKSFSLFDDDDDDDDDNDDDTLFSSKIKSSTKSETSSNVLVEEDEFEDLPVTAKLPLLPSFDVKSPLGSKSAEKEVERLFIDDTEDDLFDVLEETKKPTPPIAPPSPQKHPTERESPIKSPESMPTEKKIVEEKGTTKSQPKSSMFSLLDDDDDDEDDLFSLPKKETKIKDTLSVSGGKGRRGSSLFEDDDLFKTDNADSPDVDLFAVKPKAETSAKTEAPKVQEKLSNIMSEPSKPQRKVPVGGVPLFGSADIFGKGKLTPEKPDVLEDITEPVPVPKVEEKPNVKSTEQISVSFDRPVDTSNTLSCATKGRAKVQSRRRPPSRKGRQAVAASSEKSETVDNVDSIFDSSKESEPVLMAARNKQDSIFDYDKPEPVLKQKQSKEESLFDDDEPKPVLMPKRNKESLFSDEKPKSFSMPKQGKESLFEDDKPAPVSMLTRAKEDSIFDDIKNPEPASTPTKNKEANIDIVTSPSTEEEDIFPMSDPVGRDIFSSAEPRKDNSFTDGLFSSTNEKKSSKITDDIFDDDIFSVPVTKSVTPALSTSPDDIFAEARTAKESSLFSSSASRKHQSKISDIFSESEDDIFSSPPPVVKPASTVAKKQPNIKQVKRESDIFDDPLLGFSNANNE